MRCAHGRLRGRAQRDRRRTRVPARLPARVPLTSHTLRCARCGPLLPPHGGKGRQGGQDGAAEAFIVRVEAIVVPQAQDRMDDFRSRCEALLNSADGLHLVPLERGSGSLRAVGQKFTD